MLWLQPVGMLLGIIMLSALGYVTLATRERPLQAINRHVNPVLGWGWALAALLSSIVWALPQFSLANGVMQQNLMPATFGTDGSLGRTPGMLIVSLAVLVVSLSITWNFGRGRTGVRIYEWILKGIVGVIVLSFMGVVVKLTLVAGTVDWSELVRGMVPKPALIFRPAEGFAPLLSGLSDTSHAFWTALIVRRQQDVMAAALSSAVGINMTFLFAYSMLRRRWGPEHRGLMTFDLGVGMLLPFTVATSCVLIAATSQFHTAPQLDVVDAQTAALEAPARHVTEYNRLLEQRVLYEPGAADLAGEELASRVGRLSQEDHYMAATLTTRDAFDLAFSLEPLLGSVFGHIIFGIGVLAMAISSITLMMVVSGFVLCELLNRPYAGRVFRLGTLAPAIGILGPFFWDRAYFWLAIPTSILTLMLLPIAYITFLLMMNNRALLGEHMPTGRRRVTWNALMALAITFITSASLYMLWTRGGARGLAVLVAFLVADPNQPKPMTMLGHVTSSYWSDALGRSIAMAVVVDGRAREGETLHIPMPDRTITPITPIQARQPSAGPRCGSARTGRSASAAQRSQP
jgi:hypothetical protein